MKERLDVLLVKRGLAPSREKAKAIIMSGIVFVDNEREDKAGTTFDEKVNIEVRGKTLKYVSRGGLKLEKAMDVFGVKIEGKTCMDVGASTGGFTDCMLQNGAVKVYSVDVGHGQLAWKLVQDDRVICMDRTNIRYVTPDQIDDVLDLSKIESNTIKFTFTDCSLQSLMMDIEKEQAMKPISEIEIRASFPNEDVYINTDATRLKQVVCNFINNARKFTEKGYIHFGYAVDPVNADFVNIFVEDTGSGIPQECQKEIFDRFYKVDTFKQGTGLGLSICKTIVEHLQGDISVESEMGKGSRFIVTLPFERQTED